MEEEKEIPASEEITEEIEIDLDEESEGENTEESLEDVKARLAKLEELASNQKVRAEKAEAKLKEVKPEKKEQTDLSQTDLYALINNKVPEEDIEDIRKVAALENISIAEALKSTLGKTILERKAEERATAEATSTGTARRADTKVSGNAVLNKARKGDLPDSEAEFEALFKARKGLE